MSKIKLFTHTDLDGVGCAILAYLAFGRENVDAEFCNYDDADDKMEALLSNSDLRNSYNKIFITDISIGEELAKAIDVWVYPCNVRLFDHHATALGLNEHEWCEVMVEDETGLKISGTVLFYNHLVRNGFFDRYIMNDRVMKNICRFVDIVRDYDTWRWKELGEEGVVCKQVNDLFHIYGRDEFIDWASRRLIYYGSYPKFPSFRDEDLLLLDQKQKDIDRYVEQKDKQLFIQLDTFGHEYGVIFAEQYFSELGNRLCEMHPELSYVAMIDICGGKVSYRTIRDDLDVGGTIAHSYGGGGHRKAAGSTFDAGYIQETILKEVFKSCEYSGIS